MNAVKKFGPWVAVLVLFVACLVLLLAPDKPVPVPTVENHRFDSLRYVKRSDSLSVVITDLEKKIIAIKASFAARIETLKQSVETVKTLPADEVVTAFSTRTGEASTIEVRTDTMVVTPIAGIRKALIICYERDAAMDGLDFYASQDSLQRELISRKDEMLTVKDNRIKTLTDEYYQSQAAIRSLSADLEKQQRKVRNRNRLLGIISGAAGVAVLVAIVR